VGFGYDDANRRSTLTLSNGVNISYSYDNESRVTDITYNFGANLAGGPPFQVGFSQPHHTVGAPSFVESALPFFALGAKGGI
jgi:hypothetical protein